MMRTSSNGLSVIKYYESLHDGDLRVIGLQPKLCPAGIVTIGYGRALRDLNGEFLRGVNGFRRMMEIYPEWETITEEEAEDMLQEDLCDVESQVNGLNLKLSQNEFDSLVSLIYNIGLGNFKTSTLLRRIRGASGSIFDAFLMWVKGNGKTLPGLIKRRRTEAVLFESGKLDI
jgi:lysozyme